jgi:hypothetical protein
MKNTVLSIDIGMLLETSTVGQLTSNTGVFFDKGRETRAKQVQLSNVQYIPAVADGILTVKAKSRGKDTTYDTSIQFEKVRYVKPETAYAVPIPFGEEQLYVMPLQNMGNLVKVHCTCMDFYWRFAMYNNRDNSLDGKPPAPYVKKTDRAPQNPDQVPGNCKHLQKLADQLRAEKLFK